MLLRLLFSAILLQHFCLAIVHVEVGDIEWETLPEDENGERRLECRNFDRKFKGPFQWRFNGTSILPFLVKNAKTHLIFLNGSNAKRIQLIGTYECCVKEAIGEACYRSRLVLKNAIKTIGLNIEDNDDVTTVEGNSYFFRLFPVKKPKSITCTHDGNETMPENIIFNTKSLHHKKKFHDYYQMKVNEISSANAGKYVCETSAFEKGTFRKVFTIFVEKERRLDEQSQSADDMTYQIHNQNENNSATSSLLLSMNHHLFYTIILTISFLISISQLRSD